MYSVSLLLHVLHYAFMLALMKTLFRHVGSKANTENATRASRLA